MEETYQKGQIDQPLVFDRVLMEQEIQRLYKDPYMPFCGEFRLCRTRWLWTKFKRWLDKIERRL